MAETGLVSVIVPTYNYGHLIHETLNCILESSIPQWECIVVDDGSSDDTAKVVEAFTQKDARFKYVFQRNAGLSAARNTGIRHSNGEFIQLLDSDDWIEKHKLELHRNYLNENPQVALVYSEVRYIIPGEPGWRYSMTDPDLPWHIEPEKDAAAYWLELLLKQNHFVVNAPLIRRKVFDSIGWFDESLKSVEDWDYWCRCVCEGLIFRKFSPEGTFALVRMHRGSMSTNTLRMQENALKVREKLQSLIRNSTLNALEQRSLLSINELEITHLHRSLQVIRTEKGEKWKATGHLFQGYPFSTEFRHILKSLMGIWLR